MKDKGLSAVDFPEGVQLLQRNNGRKRHGCLEEQLVFWLKYRVKGERGRCGKEVSEKEAGVVDPSQSENSSVYLAREFGLAL